MLLCGRNEVQIMKPYNTAIRLKEIMDTRNIKQVDILNLCKPFCKKYDIKLGKNDLSQYVNGKVEPGQEKLDLLAEALQVSEAWLMGYDVPMTNNENTSTTQSEEEKEIDRQILEVFSRLSPERQKQALEYLAFLAAQE